MQIIAYQIVIFILIMAGAIFFGQRGLTIALIATTAWTSIEIFTHWLMVLQFTTIGLGAALGSKLLVSAKYLDYRFRFRKALVGLVYLSIAGACIVMASIFYLGEFKEKSIEAERIKPVAIQQSESAKQTAELALQNKQYETVVADVERRHPELNPDLPKFRKDLVEQILVSKASYIKQGMAEHQALLLAVADMEARPTPVVSYPTSYAQPVYNHSSNTTATSARQMFDEMDNPNKCAIKSVMTDEDYQRCGVTAPTSR